MSFNGINIDQMFAEAASAAEETGEKDPKKYSEQGAVVEPSLETKPEPALEIKPESVAEVKPTPAPEIQPELKSKVESKPLPVEPVLGNRLTVLDVSKVLQMKKVLDTYNDTERNFIMRYFESSEALEAEVIFNALTKNPNELEALSNIVKARKSSAAERAFYLMDLSNEDIIAIYDEVELLTGELGESGTLTDKNKISVCRSIEKAISAMPEEVFAYIDKLQEFTSKAISE